MPLHLLNEQKAEPVVVSAQALPAAALRVQQAQVHQLRAIPLKGKCWLKPTVVQESSKGLTWDFCL